MVFTTGRFGLNIALLFVLVLTCLAPRLDKRELVYVLFVHVFVYFARVNFYSFSLPLGVRVWLWFVILALSGLLY